MPVCEALDKTATALLDNAFPSDLSGPAAAETGGKSKLKSATMVPVTTAEALTSLRAFESEPNC